MALSSHIFSASTKPSPAFITMKTSSSSGACHTTHIHTVATAHDHKMQVRRRDHHHRLVTLLCSPLNSSSSSTSDDAGGGWEDDGEGDNEMLTPTTRIRRAPVFGLIPVKKTLAVYDPVHTSTGYDLMMQWFMSFAHTGVHGVLVEVWWDLVEKRPRVYDWDLYFVMAEMARRCGLKVRAVLAFHEFFEPTGPFFLLDYDIFSLPKWVRDEITTCPDLAYCDRFGKRRTTYISLGCDDIALLRGRTPIQVYADLMRSFRDTFESYLGEVITGIQIGMGPDGELKYPSFFLDEELQPIRLEFQCYDKFMLDSLSARALSIGKPEWGCKGELKMNPDETFFVGGRNSWNTPYGHFFLQWYSEQLLMHGERICKEAYSIFSGTGVSLSAKVPAIYWHYLTDSHSSELTSGYYNCSTRDGYSAICQMLARYEFSLCCPSFGLRDDDQMSSCSSPEGFLRAMISTARTYNLPVEGEALDTFLDDDFIQQVVKMSKLYSLGSEKPKFSFNLRMDRDIFEDWAEWVRRYRCFVREMCDAHVF